VAPGVNVTYSAMGESSPGADAVLVVVGETPYAEGQGDRKSLSLSEKDHALISKAKEAGVPVVTVVISGRPLILDNALEMSDALVAAWLPSSERQGVADVLFGDYKPTGKLSRAWPASNEQISGQANPDENPLLPYGFGLSY